MAQQNNRNVARFVPQGIQDTYDVLDRVLTVTVPATVPVADRAYVDAYATTTARRTGQSPGHIRCRAEKGWVERVNARKVAFTVRCTDPRH